MAYTENLPHNSGTSHPFFNPKIYFLEYFASQEGLLQSVESHRVEG